MPVPQFSKLFNSDVHRHVMLDQPAKCYPSQTILCSIVSRLCHVDFQDVGPYGEILLLLSYCVTSLSSEDQCLAHHIFMITQSVAEILQFAV